MNEQLQSTIDKLLLSSMEAFSSGAEWLAGEVPEVIEQLLLFSAIEAIMSCLLFLLIPLSLAIGLKKTLSHKDFDNDEPGWIIVIVFISVTSIIMIPISVIEFYDNAVLAMKIIVAPKLFLLEYASNLIK